MKTLLEIRSSLLSDNSQSTRLADAFVAAWRAQNPDGEVIVRDVAHEPVPHLDALRFGAFTTNAADRTAEQQAIVAYSDALIGELKQADVIVLALPMYNFGVPSTLKAYFDHLARAGETFRYTASGPVGLVQGKSVYVFATRGGLYAGTPSDTQTGFIRTFLGFLGMTNVEFVYAEGLAISEPSKTRALADAHARIAELAAPELEAA